MNYKHIIAKLPMLTKKKLINNSHMLTHSHALNRKASVNNSGLLKKLTYQSRHKPISDFKKSNPFSLMMNTRLNTTQ